MNEYQVGDNLDTQALEEFAALLRTAYENGAAKGSSMDWNDVQRALDMAVKAFGKQGQLFMAVAESNEGFEDEPTITFPNDLDNSSKIRSAAMLLVAYSYPGHVKWEDVDVAWEILQRDEPAAGLNAAL